MENNQNNQLSNKEQYELKRQERLGEQSRVERKRALKSKVKIALVVLVIVGVLGSGIWYFTTYPSKPRTNRQVALTCTTDMATQFHIHPNLTIIIKDVQLEVPANTGISNGCMNAIHTHDNSGTLHVESPEKRDFTLSDFFAVWGKDINSFGTNVKMTVNGQENTELEDYIMQDKDRIELRYEPR